MSNASANAFSSAMRAALDQYDVPALPSGFADRLIARVEAEAAAKPAVHKPAGPHRRSVSPWRRAGRWMGSVATVGLMSATAAAMGLLGEPVEVPVISDIARTLDIVAEPEPAAIPIARKADSAATGSAQADLEIESVAGENMLSEGQKNAQNMLERVTDAPRFKQLRPRQKAVVLRAASRKLIRSGQATPEELRSVVQQARAERRANRITPARAERIREKIQNATPAQKEKLLERIETLPPERQEVAKERLAGILAEEQTASPEPPALAPAESVEETTPSTEEAEPVEMPEITADDNMSEESALSTIPAAALPLAPRRLEQLRERYQQATPAERARMRERAKQIRKTAKPRPNLRDRRAQMRRRRN